MFKVLLQLLQDKLMLQRHFLMVQLANIELSITSVVHAAWTDQEQWFEMRYESNMEGNDKVIVVNG